MREYVVWSTRARRRHFSATLATFGCLASPWLRCGLPDLITPPLLCRENGKLTIELTDLRSAFAKANKKAQETQALADRLASVRKERDDFEVENKRLREELLTSNGNARALVCNCSPLILCKSSDAVAGRDGADCRRLLEPTNGCVRPVTGHPPPCVCTHVCHRRSASGAGLAGPSICRSGEGL